MTDMDLEVELEKSAQLLGAATRRQWNDRSPDHGDWYSWGWALTEILDRIDQAASVLGEQIPRYGDRHVLRDDAGSDPAERLTEASELLATLRMHLDGAREQARLYHSAIGHVGVVVDTEGGR